MVAPQAAEQRQKAASTEDAKPAPGPAPAGVDPNAESKVLAQNFKDLRGDVQRWGAAVGLVATTVLTGVGWTQLNKLFPLPPHVWWIAPVAIASTVAAIGGSAFIFLRLYAAQRRILVGTENPPPSGRGLKRYERRRLEVILDEQARVEEAVHLQDLDARSIRIQRIATRLDQSSSDLAPFARSESERLQNYVGLALDRSILALLENRTRKAISGVGTWIAFGLAAFGIAGLFAVSNYSDGKRQQTPAEKAIACLKTVDSSGTAAGFEQITLDEGCAKLVSP
ncbi:MAG TPA: hypothetical protein VKP14_05980 [Gaiellaceae bacterium]|nr:hypothetical protein [Gaiellaceae bacterium]